MSISEPLAQQFAGQRVVQTVSRDAFEARASARVADDRSHPAGFDRSRRCVDGENTRR